jgi:MFS family permease
VSIRPTFRSAPDENVGSRQLRLFAAAVAFTETTFFAVLAPLLPNYAARFGLSQTATGLLVAAYPAGVLAATLPAGMLASRYGPRRAARAGMAVLAASSFAFAVVATSPGMVVARFSQGIGAAVAWAAALAWITMRAPARRRGQIISATIAASFAGTVAAPPLALISEHVPRAIVFVPLSIGLAMIAVWAVVPAVWRRSTAAPAYRDRSSGSKSAVLC